LQAVAKASISMKRWSLHLPLFFDPLPSLCFTKGDATPSAAEKRQPPFKFFVNSLFLPPDQGEDKMNHFSTRWQKEGGALP
jgi:hypothetical protein